MTAAPPSRLLARSVRRAVFAESFEGGERVVRKEFLARTPLRRLRETLKGALGQAASQREARALRAMAEADVRAPRLVDERATGPGTRRLVQTFVAGERLVDCLGEPRRRRRVLERIGAELRRAHRAGWVHHDLHEENVLVDGDTPTLIDWQRARPEGHLEEARAWDVARFEHSMWLLGVPLGDRMRFRRAALGVETRGAGGGPRRAEGISRARLRAIEPVIRRRARRFAAVRTRRVARAEDGRTRVDLDGRRGLRGPEIGEAELRAVLDAHARLAEASAARVTDPIGRFVEPAGECVLKRDHRAVITAVCVGGRRFVVKEGRKAGLRRRLADAFRGSPARRAFVAGHGLALRGIGTARPFAWLDRRVLGVPVASWVVLEDLRGLWPVAEPEAAAEIAEGDAAREASRPDASDVADALARLLVRLHAADVAHGDLQALHVLLRPKGQGGGRVEALLIDCDGVRFEAGLDDATRVRELAALNASIPDRLLPASARREVFDRLARRVPFEAPAASVAGEVVRASLERDQQWRGEGCAASRAQP